MVGLINIFRNVFWTNQIKLLQVYLILTVSRPTGWLVGFMVFNATFNNISVISWRSILLVEETGEPGENHRPATSH
jgi:hypothetical protein